MWTFVHILNVFIIRLVRNLGWFREEKKILYLHNVKKWFKLIITNISDIFFVDLANTKIFTLPGVHPEFYCFIASNIVIFDLNGTNQMHFCITE